ncbi:quaternary amine ABC transporter ATP-binding protein [Tichowtungia aerotolerans]|uniref:Betaine/proline/choline family ABC transporter ATP-binding protein n=1 Tax=Tichowtungia aerotolerans TaxID=2697043 RepID=A0A6P1M1H9_9BACT|nr:glycine betaine/L-proline ABC transporter ATP-binding protein [Tichowtungia aerotolerans]QHI68679.1 betaine/proline/choline family ABC transporter ATP-binding protein [Tichowtungia aerotolerans]
MSIIKVNGLFKIFGPDPQRVFPMIEKGLTKNKILDKTGCGIGINNASFEIRKKEIFVLMGLSGSGKSTVIRCLNRLIDPTRGEILIDGQDIMKMSKEELLQVRRSKLSMVFQHFGLLPHRSVIRNVEYGLEVAGTPAAEARKSAEEALELVGLKGYEDSMPDELSGGMQQRVGLARALASNPEVLLMDEAFSALDPLIRTQMQDELLELQSRMHKTIVFITHDLDEALKLGDRIGIMKDGSIVQIGTPEEILTNPADEYVERFVENVDRSKVIAASSLMRKARTITVPKDGSHVAVRAMEKQGISSIFAVDADRRLQGLLTVDDAVKLERAKKQDVTEALQTDLFVAGPDTPIADLLTTAMNTRYPIAIQDDDGRLLGLLDRAAILAEMYEDSGEEQAVTPLEEVLAEAEEAKDGDA